MNQITSDSVKLAISGKLLINTRTASCMPQNELSTRTHYSIQLIIIG